MRFFSMITLMVASTAAVKVCDDSNAAGNPLCDQGKEIETSSDRQWTRLRKSHKIVKVTSGENKAKQARDKRKERDGQLKARAAARAIRNHIESQKAKPALHQRRRVHALHQEAPKVPATPKSESDTSSDSDPDPETPAPAPPALHQRAPKALHQRTRRARKVNRRVGRERDANGDSSETTWEQYNENRSLEGAPAPVAVAAAPAAAAAAPAAAAPAAAAPAPAAACPLGEWPIE